MNAGSGCLECGGAGSISCVLGLFVFRSAVVGHQCETLLAVRRSIKPALRRISVSLQGELLQTGQGGVSPPMLPHAPPGKTKPELGPYFGLHSFCRLSQNKSRV